MGEGLARALAARTPLPGREASVLLAAHEHIVRTHRSLTREQKKHLKLGALHRPGEEVTPDVALALGHHRQAQEVGGDPRLDHRSRGADRRRRIT